MTSQVYVFKIALLNRKNVTREVEVGGNSNLYNLAEAIVDAYNFNFDHAFGFFNKISNSY